MTGGEVITMARARAGISQRELARRMGMSQAQLSRLEAGLREASFEVVQRVAAACGLHAQTRLFTADDSLSGLADEQLALSPAGRLAQLVGGDEAERAMRALEAASELGAALVSGSIAAVLHGGPNVPSTGMVAVVFADPAAARAGLQEAGWLGVGPTLRFGAEVAREPWIAPTRGMWDLELVDRPAGTRGFADLAGRAVRMDGVPLAVVDVLDLLRISHASPWIEDQADLSELDVLLDRRRARAAVAV